MPAIEIWLYREDLRVPVVEWMSGLASEEAEVVSARILMLHLHGNELRRPHADLLEDGIWELRVRHRKRQLRVLYFFDGRGAVVLAHGLVKRGARMPAKDVALAVRRRDRYRSHPAAHRFPFGA